MPASLPRRAVFRLAGAAAALMGLGRPAAALTLTPPQTAGPFYPPPADRPGDTDWDLVRIAGQVREAGGEVLHLAGRVLDATGAPVPGALVEIWQCDANGRYLHRGDSAGGRERDTGFQGYGAVRASADGQYRFRTILPVPYPGRTPHIHARILRPDGRELVTQIYLKDHPLNRDDFLFRRLDPAARAAASIVPGRRADGDFEAGFDLVA